MPLKLVIGPANAAKAGEVLGAYRAHLPSEPLLVVPTRADAAFYERELAEEATVLGGAVVSFGGLVREIARRAGYAARVVRRLGRERLVAEAVAGTRLRALGPSAQGPGFAAAAAAFLAELAGERVDAERLEAALRGWAGEGRDRRAHAAELVDLARRYEAALARAGRVDEDAFAWRAVDALRRRPADWRATPVFLYGFDDLTSVQRDVVLALSSDAGAEVTVSLPYEPRSAFAGRASTVEELRPAAAQVVVLEAREDFYAPASAAVLHHLERWLFEPEAPRADPSPAIRLLEAGGERAEAELVAAEVAALVAAGLAPEDVAVVHRGGPRAAALLSGALGTLDLPVAGEWTVPAGHTTLGRGLVGLLRAALVGEASAGDLLTWLRTPGVLRRPELADRLELELRQAGVRDAAGARARWEAAHPDFHLGELDRLRGAGPGLVGVVRDTVLWLFSAPFAGRAPVLDEREAEDARVLAAVLAALDELEELTDAAPGRPADLPGLLAALPVTLGEGARPGAVTLADPLGIRARRLRAVVVCGLQAGAFPRPARPEPFLPAEARGELAAAGLRVRLERDTAAEERYLFYACASRPTDVLVLSRQTSDEEGNPELRSPFLDDVERLFAAPLGRAERPLAEVTWRAERAPTPRERVRAEAAAGRRSPLPGLGDLCRPAVRALARHTDVMSAGALEAYAGCPVKWLVERELQPERLEPDPDALRRGGFIHDVLERTLTELRARTGSARVTPDTVGVAQEIMATAVADGREALEADLPAVTARSVVRGIGADLRRYLEHAAATGETPYEPERFEQRFGFDAEDPDAVPALVVGEGEDAVRVRGAIDRVDVGPGGRAIVRDYKSGKARDDMAVANWPKRSTLQIGVYMLAVRDLLGLIPVGGLYQPLRGGRASELRARGVVADLPETEALVGEAFVDRDVLALDEVDAALDEVGGRVVELARDLRAGHLTPRPDTCGYFGGCAYPGICRSGA